MKLKNFQLSAYVNSIIDSNDKSKKSTIERERVQPQGMIMSLRNTNCAGEKSPKIERFVDEEVEISSLRDGVEKVDFVDSSSNNMKHPVIVKASHLTTKVKELVNRFSRLFQEMKANGKDNAEELYILLDELEENGTFTHEDCRKAFNTIEDIHNKLSN